MINTDWEDDGEALKAVKWHADAWAAECAWNASTTSLEALQPPRRARCCSAKPATILARPWSCWPGRIACPPMKGMFNARFWEKDFVPKASPPHSVSRVQLAGGVRPALQHLEACRREARCNQHVLEVFLFGARRMELIGQRMLDGLEAAQLYEQACQASTAELPSCSASNSSSARTATPTKPWAGNSPLSGSPRASLTRWTGPSRATPMR